MAEFRMPSLGADMDRGTVLEWLVRPGDTVHKGDLMAVVDTAKSAVEVETFADGVVEKILITPGEEVEVGTVLATLSPVGEPARIAPAPAALAPSPPAPSPPAPSLPAPSPTAPSPPSAAPKVSSPLVRRRAAELGVDLANVQGTGKRGAVTRADVEHAAQVLRSDAPIAESRPLNLHRASPYARRVAHELGVDLAAVTATGRNGAIRAEDVRAAAAGGSPPPQAVQPIRPSRPDAMRETIARVMARSKREIPHYYLSTAVDLDESMRWLRERNRQLTVSERLVPAALLLKASAVAARQHPGVNGFWTEEGFTAARSVHLGVAISLRAGGLVAPALHDAADLSVTELMSALRDLVARARRGRLRRAELADPTITVTNLGDQGVESVFGVIYPPQVALVGFGRVVDRPVAVEGLLGVRPTVTLTLSADHRATDGFTGARFLATIDGLLQHPEAL
jgi:pyruvate dehydrogenase E2 component (dihydrolipoamide acetyltransferase)